MFQNRTLTHDISSHFFLSYKVVSGDTYFPLMLRQKYFVYMEGRKRLAKGSKELSYSIFKDFFLFFFRYIRNVS